ncbi:hypothetical protein HUG10_09815 [Halorarum halophilum]|uniref:DUF7344 domain-containing protein n=1 Tax=Halorarum halophilum TaxID=2743090 RepID=A0A7D5GFK6_9EURY|nr:hypothetical protein [Halobaculum halophilum]QLG27830.1 hypothetical protein HUG10_09815 [Halobaculum halophilum]
MASSSTVETVGEESGAVDADDDRRTDGNASPVGSSGDTEEPSDLPSDVVFGLLSAERRRNVLRYLHETDGEATIGEVAEYVGAEENGIEERRLSSTQRKRAYVGLYQNHLPKLDDANVIDYERARGTIELGEGAEQLFPHLYLDSTDPEGGDSGDEVATSNWLDVLRARIRDLIPF